MEQWETDFYEIFVKTKNLPDREMMKIKHFIDNLLKAERSRNMLLEVLDYVKRHNSKTDMLVRYVMDNASICERTDPSQELLEQLGIEVHEGEARILYILEKHFNPPKETGT